MSNTKDARVRVVNHGPRNWRTEVRDAQGDWYITGEPYTTKLEALANVDTAIARNF